MQFYNAKTKTYYKSKKIYVVGESSEAVGVIVACGFFRAMIHIDDGGPISDKCQFVVVESVPKDWAGEIVLLSDFAKTIKTFAVKKAQAKTTKQVATTSPCGRQNSKTTPSEQACPQTHCRYAEHGEMITPCRGRKIVCRHVDLAGIVRAELNCRPPDPAKDLNYNLRSCILYAD